MNSKNSLNKTKVLAKGVLKNGLLTGRNILKNGQDAVEQSTKALTGSIKQKVTESVDFVDDALGVSEVSKAQNEVSLKENSFLTARGKVQDLRTELESIQESLNDTRNKLDRTDRTHENYLTYVADEHNLLLQVKELSRLHQTSINTERTLFVEYSAAVRLSHEKERSRVERTKYWSIIASVSGTVLGFMLSSLVTHHRLSSIKEITLSSFQNSTKSIEDAINEQSSEILTQTKDIRNLLGQNQPKAITDNPSNEPNQQEYFEKLLVPILERLDKLSTDASVVAPASQPVNVAPPPSLQTEPNEILGERDHTLHDAKPTVDKETIIVSASDPPPVVQYTPLVLVVSAAALLLYSMIGQS